jgi:cell division transport system ATP-binding protein
MILFESVSKLYVGNVAALKNINVRIENGEFVFLVGNSGAGKTTMLRLLNREILPSSGKVVFDSLDIHTLPRKKVPFLRRSIGFIFQDFKLLPDRTVAENIAVALDILGKRSEERERRIDEVLDFVKLKNRKHAFPRELSLGEQQRVAIGRAIAGDIRLLIADEPTGNLDPKTSWEILRIINTINKQGITVVMATHNVDIVDSMKKRVIVLKEGQVIRDEKKSRYS